MEKRAVLKNYGLLGALLAVGVLYVLKRSGVLDRMQSGLDR